MTPDDLKERLLSSSSTPADHASVALRKVLEIGEQFADSKPTDETAAALHRVKCFEKIGEALIERFQAAQDETLAAVSHVLDEIVGRLVPARTAAEGELRNFAKALRGGADVEKPDVW